ncbi:MAG: flagellin [Clostridiales bacterium]|jgi:flagellin|nr:flagellin [Clostridiales bacterium]
MSAYDMSVNQLYKSAATQLSSGRRINSAANDASGLAISEKLVSQINGYDTGTNNARDMQNLMRTAEGGLSVMNDALLRVRELAVQASNGIYTDEDKGLIQEEVSQLLQEINTAAKSTEFNKIKLLDGNFMSANTADNPSGNGTKISIEDATLSGLGLEGFDVTGKFDISVIDEAISRVSASRSKIGAQSNVLDHVISSGETTSINLAAANSRLADADMGLAAMNFQKANILQQVQIYSLTRAMDTEKQKLGLLGI